MAHFDNINDIFSAWNSLSLEILDKHTPIKCHRVKSKFQSEWLTPDILDCMKEKKNKCKLNGNISLFKNCAKN